MNAPPAPTPTLESDAGTLEQIELHVDLDDEPMCEWHECESAASWRGVLRPCSHSSLYCDPHRKSEQGTFDCAEPGDAYCATCEADLTRIDWLPL